MTAVPSAPRGRRDAGFTLLEVMVALAIIAGTVFTVISAVNYHLSISARDREETAAILLARQKIEELLMDKETGKQFPEKKDGTFAPARPDYAWQMATTPTDYPGFSKLTLTVSWGGKKRSMTFVRYLEN